MEIFKLLTICFVIIISCFICAIPIATLFYYSGRLGVRLGRWLRNRNYNRNEPQSILELIKLANIDKSRKSFYIVEEYNAPLLIRSEFSNKDIIPLRHIDVSVTSITREEDKWVLAEVWRSVKNIERVENIVLEAIKE